MTEGNFIFSISLITKLLHDEIVQLRFLQLQNILIATYIVDDENVARFIHYLNLFIILHLETQSALSDFNWLIFLRKGETNKQHCF
jgi:hypothetical protein